MLRSQPVDECVDQCAHPADGRVEHRSFAGRGAPPAGLRSRSRSRSAAAASCGAAARTLSRSPSPALMPPSNGSTNRSNTASPSCARTSAPTDTSSWAPSGVSAGRTANGSVTMPEALTASRSVGTPSTSPAGSCRSAPSHHTYAEDAAGETRVVSRSELVAQVERPRHTGEECVRAFVDQPSGERRCRDLAAEAARTPRGRRSRRRAGAAAAHRRPRGRRCLRRRRRPDSCRQRSHFGGQCIEHLGVVVQHRRSTRTATPPHRLALGATTSRS